MKARKTANQNQSSTIKNMISKLKRKINIFTNVFHDILNVYRHNKHFEFVNLQKSNENFDDEFDVVDVDDIEKKTKQNLNFVVDFV